MKIKSIFKVLKEEKTKGKKEDKNHKKNFEVEEKNLKDEQNFKGLSNKNAQKLLKKYGENSIASQKNISAVKIFAGQFKDFLVLILLAATIISIFMGEVVEAVSISIILFLNAIMGFIQEFKTETTLKALDEMVTPTATVIRDGKKISIPANKIVENDLIFIKEKETVPADAVILKSKQLEVDESILTGESVCVLKQETNQIEKENKLNKPNLVYMGTSVVKGEGVCKVISTGKETQMGKIAKMIENIEQKPTPLQKKLNQMGKFLIIGCLLVCFLVILVGILRGEPAFEMIIIGLSLAVASVPEGLPAIVTIVLAFSVKQMIKKKALVRKLHAVETLGCANIICTDKTGTITQNKMTVKKIVTQNFEFNVTGGAFKKEGEILLGNEPVSLSENSILKEILTNFVVCNFSSLKFNKEKNRLDFYGEPTEAALLVAALKKGIEKENVKFKVFEKTPFSSSKKYMSVFAEDENGRRFIFVKGAYDVVFKQCSFYKEEKIVPFSLVKNSFDLKNKALSTQGMRVLAFAYKELNQKSNENEENLIFLGLCAMQDPPRKEAKKAVLKCKNAGIKTVMITGDGKFTAKAIAKDVGIFKKGDLCLEGKDLDKLTDFALKDVISRVTVFARVSPSHKLRIVKAFKKDGNVVAMTGDGVNDAPAIKEAEIGVCMGISGSEVAKQAADLVLLDDNFSTLVETIQEGRKIYKNIRKFMRYLLSCNIGEVLTSLFAILMGMPIPMLPMQILLINLVTDSLPAIALGLEPKEKNIMNVPPRDSKESIFSKGLLFTIVVRGFLIAVQTLTVFTVIFRLTLSIDLSRTASFLSLVSLQLIHVFECKSETKPIFKINFLNNKKLIFCVLVSFSIAISAVFLSPFNKIFKNYPLNFKQTLIVVFLTLLVPILNAIFLTIRGCLFKKNEFENVIQRSINF